MQNQKLSRRAFLRASGAFSAAVCGAALTGCAARGPGETPPAAPSADQTAQPEENAALPQGEYRAMWLSYLEWQSVDFSSEEAFRAAVCTMLDHCTELGLNTVLAQVRPFGDALYESALFPWSHLCTGTQGAAPGFDPLNLLLTEAHARGLSLEAWINPYRLRLSAKLPAALAESNLAYTHPAWTVTVGEGIYLNPAMPEAAEYVVQGVAELVEKYAVDGIHFDDYFYPATDAALDAEQFAVSGEADLAAWRRKNVTALVKAAHDAVKAKDPTLRFGVSPQGNFDNNYSQQFSDISAWMTAEGGDAVVDYICPQLYWGYHFTLKNGSQRYAYENVLPEWLALPRAAGVALVPGLGAWRIGDGDGGQNDDSVTQWNTGTNLAQMVADARAAGADGWALYRYGSLFASAWPELAAAECAALAAANAQQG